jgi:DNA polymerase III subunit gamma/tau
MTYIPLYRKWRSQTFDEVVGQIEIIRTLKNAIKSGRVSHAYLFSGPRGTGKTSTARIFAKALNCEKGPTENPCGKCGNCEKIKNGHAIDVIEIDAASNRGIDEIRDLRDKVRYSPVEAKYKVYIIDEVHMLTSEAFNALLKTLEEPPAHAIFILATTEPQKVPVTIASRCQRLDFKRITAADIAEQIKMIAKSEAVKIDDDAVALISRNSEGAMRDAISLFDQLISFAGRSIKKDDVVTLLGSANTDMVFDFADKLISNDIAGAFSLIATMSSQGRSIPQVTKDILLHLRNLLLVKVKSEAAIEETAEHIEKLRQQAENFSLDRIKYMIKVFSRSEVDMKWHPQASVILEIAVVEAGETPQTAQTVSAPRTEPKIEQKVPATVLYQKAVQVAAIKKPELRTEPSPKVTESLISLKNNWQTVLDEAKKANLSAYISLHEGEPVEFSNGKLIIKFKKGFAFHKERLSEAANRSVVEATIKKLTGSDIKVECVIEDAASPKQDMSVGEVAEIFGGTVM